jgi:hypothetical protein
VDGLQARWRRPDLLFGATLFVGSLGPARLSDQTIFESLGVNHAVVSIQRPLAEGAGDEYFFLVPPNWRIGQSYPR